MQANRFDDIVERRLAEIRRTLVIKGKEYATNSDRLHNFKKLSSLQGQHSVKSLLHLCDKQYVSLHDFCNEVNEGNMRPLDAWREKIGDVINYMILMEAVVEEATEDINVGNENKEAG